MVATDLNLVSLQTFLDAYLPKAGQVTAATRAGSGQSNPTYVLHMKGGPDLVLRRKPLGTLLPSAHAIDREYRIMGALAETDVPVPRMVAYCADETVLGAEFFLMERVIATAHMDPRLKEMQPAERTQVMTHMAQVLGRLHAVDMAAVGLQDYGAPGLYFARNLARWIKQYRAAETQIHSQIEELIDWLQAYVPQDQGQTCLVHGDYRLDNLLLAPETGRIAAVVDWELSTTGDPLSDLGAVFMQWSLPPGREGRGLMGIDRPALGLLSDAAFTDAYLAARGEGDLRDLSYATTFAFFRMAAILQGVVKRGLSGNAADPEGAARMAAYIPLFAAGGLMAAGKA